MNLIESVRVALRALVANKLRTALTMLGVIIGVGAVIALMSIGRGMQAMVTSQIRGMGTNLLFVSPGAQQQGGVRQQAGTAPTLTYEDALAIVESGYVPEAVAAAPEQFNFGQVVANGQNMFTRLSGVTPSFTEVRNWNVAAGDFVTREHIDARALVAVLGANVAETLFGDSDPIGQAVRINQANFRVIGVMERRGAQALGSQDEVILLPLTTMQTRLHRARNARGAQNVNTIYVQVADERLIGQAVQNIGDLLRERHRTAQDDFTIRSQEDMLATANQITGVITLFLGSVAGISLLVGGIGIMNIMLVSVTERTREIGIRKAVGAKRRDILAQFLVEATVVSVLGGAIGILLGTGGSRLLNGLRLGGANAQPLQTLVAPDAVLLAFTVSALVGLFFGIYPATRASRLHPIEALRYE